MKTVLLAAGMSSRLRPYTDNSPKCLLTIGRSCMLERTLDNLCHYGLTDIIIVTGYRHTMIEDFVRSTYPELAVTFVHNPHFESTNNIYSLWLTKQYITGHELLLLDSDILFDKHILGQLLTSSHNNCLALRSGLLGEEEIKVSIYPCTGSIREIGKTIPLTQAVGESIGIEKFDTESTRKLFEIIDDMIFQHEMVNVFYEAAFQRAIRAGMQVFPVNTNHYLCAEIDTIDDFITAENTIVPFLDAERHRLVLSE